MNISFGKTVSCEDCGIFKTADLIVLSFTFISSSLVDCFQVPIYGVLYEI